MTPVRGAIVRREAVWEGDWSHADVRRTLASLAIDLNPRAYIIRGVSDIDTKLGAQVGNNLCLDQLKLLTFRNLSVARRISRRGAARISKTERHYCCKVARRRGSCETLCIRGKTWGYQRDGCPVVGVVAVGPARLALAIVDSQL